MNAIPERVLPLVESLNAHLPLGPSDERIENPRYVVWLGVGDHPSFTVVQRLRLRPPEVAEAVEEVRALLRARGRRASTWEVGSSATPPDLAERLLSLGMVPDRDPDLAGMVLTEPPAPPAGEIVVRRVETLDEYRAAQEIWIVCFELDEDEAASARARGERAYAEQRVAGHEDTFLARLEGETVAAATAIYTDVGVVLAAGATLPEARGRGAYRALVAARWEEAVRRGTPVLITQAGALSRPILERLGFRAVAEIRIFLDELG